MASDFHIRDDEPDPTEGEDRAEQLNFNRIRAIAIERRAAYRRLFWARAVVFAFASLSLMTAVDTFRVKPGSKLWFSAAAIVFALLAIRAALRLPRFKVPAVERPAAPPIEAFDSLSNGSQFAKNLDALQGPAGRADEKTR